MIAIDEEIAAVSATLRAAHGLKRPNAIYIGTGLLKGCTAFSPVAIIEPKLGSALYNRPTFRPFAELGQEI